MAARFPTDRVEHAERHARMAEIERRAAELREELLELGERELHAYAPVIEALRLPREDPLRAEQVAAARSRAAESPLAVARAAAEVASWRRRPRAAVTATSWGTR
jgi:formiminotetrahydrofolate cyclodeaminase